LSTTLATNALVEGHGGRVGLISIGFSSRDLERQGLGDAMKGDPVLQIAGGHSYSGGEATPLDMAALESGIAQIDASVGAFAVAGAFATRNPAHEHRVRDRLRELTGKPVSCSSELSAQLNGPKRAITSVLNARLIALIDRLIGACKDRLVELGISAPLMVVRGDGALISAAFAQERPIETILSGPAASIVGAQWLTGESEALVADIGGTTTDIAILHDGRPAIDPQGAKVGDFRTMVEAVAMRTWGLGGDSEVHMATSGLTARLSLGPRRVMPVSLAAIEFSDVILPVLERQAAAEVRGQYDGRFAIPTGVTRGVETLTGRDLAVYEKIGKTAYPLAKVVSNRMEQVALERLVSRGLVMIAGVTPSDAAHVLGMVDVWNRDAAELALTLFGRQRTGAGEVLSRSAVVLAQMIVDQLTQTTSLCLLETGFAEDGDDPALNPAALARHWITQKGINTHRGVLNIDVGLNMPIIGLGASARSYYPAVGKQLSTKMILPEHGGVANAIGAVAGRVSVTLRGTITSPSEGSFRVHFEDGPQDFISEDKAVAALDGYLTLRAIEQAKFAGAGDIELTRNHDITASEVESRRIFIEATLSVTAAGRPRIATG
jgi:N-methylhydantoinase A/oxoprolinase/acetone carboxylase beta subunit